MELFDVVYDKFDVVYDKISNRMVRKSHCPEELKEFCRENRCFILTSRNIHYYIFRHYIIVSERYFKKRIPHRLSMISLYILKKWSLQAPATDWLYSKSVTYTYESHTLLNSLLNRSEVISEKDFNQQLNQIQDLDIKYLKETKSMMREQEEKERLQRNPYFPYSFDTSTTTSTRTNYFSGPKHSAFSTSWGCSDTSTSSNAQNSMVYNSCSGIYSPSD